MKYSRQDAKDAKRSEGQRSEGQRSEGQRSEVRCRLESGLSAASAATFHTTAHKALSKTAELIFRFLDSDL
jgi:hypothetical protein